MNPGPFTPAQRRTLGEALDRGIRLSFDVFKAQVVPYLAPAHQEAYGTPDAWARICELVVDRLSEFLP